MGTLLLASSQDSASINLLSSLLDESDWSKSENCEHGKVFSHNKKDVQILLIDEMHIHANDIDKRHESETGFKVDEVLVLSRHVSSSERAAMTLHAIGLPGERPHGELGSSGGVKGEVVPPSTKFGSLFRSMVRFATEDGLDSEYDLTMEATHHGPLLSSPTLYIEIGSTEERWSDKRASRVWAKVICCCLGLYEEDIGVIWPGEGDVMVGFGGGHYAPRHKSVVTKSNVWLGHIIAGYSLDFGESGQKDGDFSEDWKHAVEVAIKSTRLAFPGGDIFAHLDRKSFKAWQRNELVAFIEGLGVEVKRGKKIY